MKGQLSYYMGAHQSALRVGLPLIGQWVCCQNTDIMA